MKNLKSYLAILTLSFVCLTNGGSIASLTDAALASSEFALTADYAAGDGSYAPGTVVTITADAPAAGKVFDKWTGDVSNVDDVDSPTTTITMPFRAVTLAATYEDADDESDEYALTVTGGTGSGSYAAGSIVPIAAIAPAAGQIFDKWTGDTDCVANIYMPFTKVDMPSHAVTLTAAYEQLAAAEKHTLTVVGGSGSGSYAMGTRVTIIADPAPEGKVFDRWTGDADFIFSHTMRRNFFPDASHSTLTIMMPDKDITLTATYRDATAADEEDDSDFGFDMKPMIISAKITDVEGDQVTFALDVMNVSQMMFAADENFTDAAWEPYSAAKVYTKAEAQTKVYFKFKSQSGTVSAVKTLDIEEGASVGGYTGDENDEEGDEEGDFNFDTKPHILKVQITAVEGNAVTFSFKVKNAAYMMIGADESFADAAWEPYAATKVYAKADGQTSVSFKFKSAAGMITPAKTLGIEAGAFVAGNQNYLTLPTGMLLKLPSSNKIYVVIEGEKKWISTPEVFEQLGYKWTEVTTTTQEQLDSISDYEDNLIRALGDYKVYMVVEGIMRHIPSPEVFLNYGFEWGDVKDVPAETLNQYKEALLIKESGKEDIYYVNKEGIRRLIPSTAVFDSYGYKAEDVQVISAVEMLSYPLSNLIKLEGGNDIYLTEGAVKKHISNPGVFKKNNLIWSYVMTVNQAEFDFYQDGGELK